MDNEQFLLGKIAEECQEIAQRALKAQQFGLAEVQPGQDKSNAVRLTDELDDLMGVLRLCCADGVYAVLGSKRTNLNIGPTKRTAV